MSKKTKRQKKKWIKGKLRDKTNQFLFHRFTVETEVYLKSCPTFKIELLAKTVNSHRPEYTSDMRLFYRVNYFDRSIGRPKTKIKIKSKQRKIKNQKSKRKQKLPVKNKAGKIYFPKHD